ncbi:MAG: hypothetical protein HY865_12660 [Chloroflexi bacterium]|nr:hypothetical protein [Chloroflexota bacterium]
MPHFYNYKNTNDFGKVAVIPKGIRRIRIGEYSILPYFTMSKVCFTLHIERLPEQEGVIKNNRNVYLQLGDGSYRTIATIYNKITDIEGTAEYTGDTKFYIAPSGYTDRNSERFIAKEGLLLFEDNVLSINHYIFGIAGILISAVLSCIVGIVVGVLLGFIQIEPYLKMWVEQ